MSILDDAIREHLELKRQHGADDVELKKLEDEAFGPPARPDEILDPFAEAPTEFLAQPGAETDEGEVEEPTGRRRPDIADLQEAPPAPPPEPLDDEEPAAEADAFAAEPSSAADPPSAEFDELPAEEEHPAREYEAIAEPPTSPEPPADPGEEAGHSTAERHAIADQPTEIFDVEREFDAAAGTAPSDEELVDVEAGEPRLTPSPSSPAPADAEVEDEEPVDDFDEFFSEQRLSDELNQALEAPVEDEPAMPPTEEARRRAEEESLAAPAAPAEEQDEDDEGEEPDSAEHEVHEADHGSGPEGEGEGEGDEGEDDEGEEPEAYRPHETKHEDALEDTPDFLEDAPEDDDLWFEQRPPKDFDFDD